MSFAMDKFLNICVFMIFTKNFLNRGKIVAPHWLFIFYLFISAIHVERTIKSLVTHLYQSKLHNKTYE